MKGLKFILLIYLCFFFRTTLATNTLPDSTLRIITPYKSIVLTRSELLSYPAMRPITINNDQAYPNKTLHLNAIPLCKLLAPYGVKKHDFVELISKDNFHAYVPATKIMACDKKSSMAMLAIEPVSKWPIIDNHTGTDAGPYQVIWLHPERSYISNEYWAWSVITIKITHKLNSKNILAPPKTTTHSIQNGYQVYLSHCEGCHSLNLIGSSHIGPDLNCPQNPLEYYPQIELLKKFIRDPESVRILPQGRMNGSDIKTLSNSDLNDLIDFFAYMKTKKQCNTQ